MKALVRGAALSLLAALAIGAAPGASAEAPKSATHWVCPACGGACDRRVLDAPGVCPVCGMTLVEQGSPQAQAQPRKKVAILVFEGVEIIDFAGPYEVFGAADFDVFTVGETKQPVTTAMGLSVVPRYAFADAPAPDVVVVPGGGVHGARASAALLRWVGAQSALAGHTLSVCNGAFILGSAGLLDGLSATTTAHLLDELKAEFPRTRVLGDRRFVDNGRIITAGGLSAGIDGALHVVSVLKGEGYAQAVALRLEYDWHPGAEFARAALADLQLPDLGLEEHGPWDLLKTQGSTDHWEVVVRPRSDVGSAALMEQTAQRLAKGHWKSVKRSAERSDWTFTGRDGRPWSGTVTIEPTPSASPPYAVRLAIRRAG